MIRHLDGRSQVVDPRSDGEGQVRGAVVETIRQHLQPDAQATWSGLSFDFRGATLGQDVIRRGGFSGRPIPSPGCCSWKSH
jgi:hypothetical protein